MKILTAYDTDIGKSKSVNQDALCIKEAQTSCGLITMALVCDGMGGYSSGEVASSTVVKAFSEWFENKLPFMLDGSFTLDMVRHEWNELAKLYSKLTVEYGLKLQPSIKLGTTLTAILITERYGAEIIHVGDSRLYKIASVFEQVTQDHTKIAYLVANDKLELKDKDLKLTQEQKEYVIEHHPERHILSQCIGGSRVECTPSNYRLAAEEYSGGMAFLICSDGFRHELTKHELSDIFKYEELDTEATMKQKIRQTIDLNIQRGETDNITAVLLNVVR